MIDTFVQLIFALPLMVMVMNFGVTLMLRFGAKSTFLTKNHALQARVSVLLPCFNEGEHVFRTIESILASDYPMEKVEVIAVDDCSADDTYEWIERAASRWSNVRAFRNPVNSGKHQTLSHALSHSSGEILICIDSDCLFDKCAIAELTACFVDETIGAVGGRVGISNARENVLTQCQTVVYYYSFQIMKMLQNWTRNVICISGCLFAVRREHFEAIEEQVKHRNWFGVGVRDGEDRYMTHLLLLKGLKTYINIDAQCWTAAPNNFRQLFMQQLRWRRSGLRDLFWTLRTFDANLKVLHPLTVVNLLIPGALQVLWPAMCIYGLASGWLTEHLLLDMQLYFGVWVVVGLLYNLYVRWHNPEQKVNPLLVGALGMWFIADSFLITLVALCTFDVGEWGTRGTSAKKA
ncbi:Glycosyltransferase, catalytic subunit of cellulose synthase and poly-beta-1,6-N-acetylglucosamine synthase [Burkholderia sp. YR290]|nr:Glycosyltransferase, catalytic subunit of cellulose synthase and poly-beta-1,6-N-acetylglucosamine synthase [Burkholderia sp. YR290]